MSLYLERFLFKSPSLVHLTQVHKNDFDDSTGKKNTSNMRPETSELKSFRKSFSVCSTGEGHNYYMLFHFSTSGSVNTL